ncbi:TonB-dependent hemoglobin/transferrin/lactoferrin family receptor [Pseudoalteromonas sp. ASV78]|uniref:TonB-dependent hemoglobin/transferrin/lactoferrin family receptor n=1 Tax=Pseudoalteromonas sp. ASV78 TaxID=3397851 RepID=UPI0039FC2EB8
MFKPTLSLITLAISSVLFHASAIADDTQSITNDELEVLVVSGSRIAKPLKDVAASISVMTAEEMQMQAVTDINQLFKYDPSIQITGRIGGAQNITVRGMGSDRILMIKDGMRMNEGYGANGLNDIVGRGFIETDTLKQVEVAKGASSSLYGSDALGGIVVFTTKDASDYLQPGEQFAGNVKAGYSDLSSQYTLAGTLAFITGDVEHVLSSTLRDGEEEQSYDGSLSPFDIESSSFMYKGKYNISETDSLDFSVDLWRQEAKGDSADGLLAYFRSLAQYGYNIVDEHTITDKETNSYQLSYHSNAQTLLWDQFNVRGYYNESSQEDEEYAFLDINAPMFGTVEKRDMFKTGLYKQTTKGLLSNASKQLNQQHTLGFGLDIETTDSLRTVHEYREADGVVSKDDSTSKFPRNDTFRAGFFINDEISFMDKRLVITPGVRFDYYEMDPNGALKTDGTQFAKIDDQHLSFNLGALYYINDMLSAYAQYGQGFKVPAYDLAYIEHYNQPTSEYIYEIMPSDDLSAEESDSYELGLRGHIGSFTVNAAVFYNEFDNFLATELVNRDSVFNADGSFSYIQDTFQYHNLDSVTIKGAEFGATFYATDSLDLFFNVAYQDGKDNSTDEYISSISPLSGNLGISYKQDDFASNVILNWAKQMTKVNEGKYQTPGYGTVDWQLSYRLADTQLNLAVNNIFDKEYYQHNNLAGHDAGDSLANLASAGRNFSATIKYNF